MLLDYAEEDKARVEWDIEWLCATDHYQDVECMYCGRTRVELRVNGKEVCEKCNRVQRTGEIVPKRP